MIEFRKSQLQLKIIKIYLKLDNKYNKLKFKKFL